MGHVLHEVYFPEEVLELRIKEFCIAALEDLSDEVARLLKSFKTDVQGSDEQLRLDILIDVVEPSDVGSTVTDHQVCQLLLELLQDLQDRLPACNVSHQLHYVFYGCHFLQVNGDNASAGTVEETLCGEASLADLAPAARRRAQINDAFSPYEHLVELVDLDELVGGPRPEAVLLGLAVVDILR